MIKFIYVLISTLNKLYKIVYNDIYYLTASQNDYSTTFQPHFRPLASHFFEILTLKLDNYILKYFKRHFQKLITTT